MKKIECIIMDWAGTAVDYGCFAPVAAFIESFNVIGTPVTAAETRAHMGLTKVEEIRALFNIDRVRNEFQEKYGRPYAEEDILARYADFSVCCLPLWKIMQHLFPVWLKRYRDCVRKELR